MNNIFIVIMLCGILCACGQKGALYLPTPTPEATNSSGDASTTLASQNTTNPRQ
ncbi:lipoprotein [Moraxella sp. Tifton1]|uniref:LPS translocon maturation chaperone LptM n=1 Tax=Moraxella oculi TaxID=2940516 RepID=UPI002011B48A|nr:lipoprotein [Moraxella sp. Tifton1]MCL1623537.1 lipoprotein [Moraxella sp. Tifton1]